jgi:hypothetical protein
MPHAYLVHLSLADASESVVDQITETAVVFLKTMGAAEHEVVGSFRREGRGSKPADVLHLIMLRVLDAPPDAENPGCGQALEGVLRTTLKATQIVKAEVRVYDAVS